MISNTYMMEFRFLYTILIHHIHDISHYQEHNTKLNTTSEHKLEVNTDSSMSINHQNINTRQIIQPKDPCTHSDTQALLGCDSMHTTGYC